MYKYDSMFLAILIWTLLLEPIQGSKFPVFHRLFLPSAAVHWTLRGHIEGERWMPTPNFKEDFQRMLSSPSSRHPDGLYQIVLGKVDDIPWSGLAMASVPICNMNANLTEHLMLLTSNRAVYSLSYTLTPFLPDACEDALHNPPAPNVTTILTIRTTTKPPQAVLRTPPPVNHQGQVIRPPAEKTFLQKYWMYFALLFLVISFAGGGDEKRGSA